MPKLDNYEDITKTLEIYFQVLLRLVSTFKSPKLRKQKGSGEKKRKRNTII